MNRVIVACLTSVLATVLVVDVIRPAPAPRGVMANAHCPAEDSCQIDYRDGHWWLAPDSGDWIQVSR